MKKLFILCTLLLAAGMVACKKDSIDTKQKMYVQMNDAENSPFGQFINFYARLLPDADPSGISAEDGFGFVTGRSSGVEIASAVYACNAYFDTEQNVFYATVPYSQLEDDYESSFYARAYIVQNGVIHYSRPLPFKLLRQMTGIELSRDKVVLLPGESVRLTATPVPSDAGYGEIAWQVEDSGVASVNDKGEIVGLSRGSTSVRAYEKTFNTPSAYCSVVVLGSIGLGVDMGTELGYWTDFNLGPDASSRTGGYCAWAETEVLPDGYKNGTTWFFTWYKYKYSAASNDWGNCTKYNASDGKISLEEGDDAAATILQNGWRIPSAADYDKLISNCTIAPETVAEVAGVRFTSKITGQSIFFPVTGYWSDNSSSDQYIHYSQENGYYWTADVNKTDSGSFKGTNYAKCLKIGSSVSGYAEISTLRREVGAAVKAIHE